MWPAPILLMKESLVIPVWMQQELKDLELVEQEGFHRRGEVPLYTRRDIESCRC